MAFCNMCGAQIADGTTTCPACAGRSVVAPAGTGAGLADNVAGMLAYFTIIPAIIFLVLEPYNRSRFVRFHAWQSIIFNVAWWILWIGLRIVVHIPLLGHGIVQIAGHRFVEERGVESRPDTRECRCGPRTAMYLRRNAPAQCVRLRFCGIVLDI